MIRETALFGTLDIQTPNYAAMGFVLGVSKLGDSMAKASGASDWTSWTGRALRVNIVRGGVRTGLGIKTDVGFLTFTLRNRQDPMAGGTFAHGQRIRLVASGVPVFTGNIIDVSASYPLDKSDGSITPLVTVTAADAVKTHVGTMRYGVRLVGNGNETFESRIARLAETSRTPIVPPSQGAPQEVYAL